MLRIRKSKRVSLLIVPFLLFSLVGQGIASTVVLCIGENNHIAIEIDSDCTEGFAQRPGLANRDSLSLLLESTSLQKAERSCLDIPLLIGSSDPGLSSAKYSQFIKMMIDRASTPLLSPLRLISEDRFFPRIPVFRLSAWSALRYTILLI